MKIVIEPDHYITISLKGQFMFLTFGKQTGINTMVKANRRKTIIITNGRQAHEISDLREC